MAGEGPDGNDGQNTDISVVDKKVCWNPPRAIEPRERTLENETDAKWCGLCEEYRDHYRLGYPDDNADGSGSRVDGHGNEGGNDPGG